MVHGRLRHLFWGLFLCVLGGLLILKFGTGGLILGVLALVYACFGFFKFGRSLLHKPGTFSITNLKVSIPTSLCSGKTETVDTANINHAYILRRHAPWNMTAPLMIIETHKEVYMYSRDWFRSEVDQKRVANSINRRKKLLES